MGREFPFSEFPFLIKMLNAKGGNIKVIRADNFKTRSAELHTEIGVARTKGEDIPWTGLEYYPDPQGHFEKALELRQSILEDIQYNAGVDPDYVACRGNVALAHINLARYLHRTGQGEAAVGHYEKASAILVESVPTSTVTIETAVYLANLKDTPQDYLNAFNLVDAYDTQLRNIKAGEHPGGGPDAQEFSLMLEEDMKVCAGWQEELLKNYGLCLLVSTPFDSPTFERLCAKYEAQVADGTADFATVHAYASFLLAHPVSPNPKRAGELYATVMGLPGSASHPDYADASFNLGVIKHQEALQAVGKP